MLFCLYICPVIDFNPRVYLFNMHLFYQPVIKENRLTGDEANHCTKVMRMQVGDRFQVTDGNGNISTCEISRINKSEIIYEIITTIAVSPRPYTIKMFIAPTRKIERNEWMVEKMVELGVDEIHFFKSEHTHADSFRRVTNPERLNRIVISAMKQSGQAFLPTVVIHQSMAPVFDLSKDTHKFIAYVTEERNSPNLSRLIEKDSTSSVLIGPEGDFSGEEIFTAVKAGFQPVSLGKTRLRTETAAIIACHCVHLGNNFSSDN